MYDWMSSVRARRRVTIAFVVTDDSVEIHGLYYGGRDYENLIDLDAD